MEQTRMAENAKTVQRAETGEDRGITRRRFLARGAAFTLAAAVTGSGLTVLSGCGGGRSSSEPLTFWNFIAPGGSNSAASQWYVDLVNAWNDKNETQIRLEYIPPQEYIGRSKVQTAFAAGEGPDLFLNTNTRFLRFFQPGVLQDLTPFMAEQAINDFYPDVLVPRTVNGKIYALPTEVEPMAIYYSVKAFEDAGLSEADIPETWDQLLEVANKVQTKDTFGVLFETASSPYQNFNWYPFMWMGGGDAVSEDGKRSNFDSEGAIQALRFWQDAIERDLAPRQALGDGAGDLVSNLSSGYCAMQECGIWGVADLRENAPGFEYGVFKLPVPPGGKYTTNMGGWSFVANSEGKDPEEAARFCVWAVGSMSDECIRRGVDWLKAEAALGPRKSVVERATEQGVLDDEKINFFRDEVFPGGRAEPRYPPEVFEPITDAIQACMLDGANPERQAEQTAERIDSFLDGYSGARMI